MKTSHVNSIADSQEIVQFYSSIINWYEKHARNLPWRVKDEHEANPYHVWLSEIMLQQTTVSAVIPYFLKFTERWPTIKDLASADEQQVMDMWAGLGYYSRARNLHKCARQIMSEHDGCLPSNRTELLKLSGIGAYTAGAIESIAFNQPAHTMDGNIERVFARCHNIQKVMPDGKKDISRLVTGYMAGHINIRPSLFVQGLMDLGATICQPKKVQCMKCPISGHCSAYSKGNALELPRKNIKQKPQRSAVCYVVYNAKNKTVLIERRQKKGLLGNMQGFPTTALSSSDFDVLEHQKEDCFKLDCFVEHVFTHFKLKLYVAKVGAEYFNRMGLSASIDSEWISIDDLNEVSMPTLFSKVRSIL